jgi:hypothetical protein
MGRGRPADHEKASKMRQPNTGPGRPRGRASARCRAEVGIDLAGDVALEAADYLCLGFSFCGAALGVGAGGRVGAQAGEHDPPQRVVGLAVTAGLSRCRLTFPDDAGIGATPHRCAQAASERSRPGWSPAAMSSSAAVQGPTP